MPSSPPLELETSKVHSVSVGRARLTFKLSDGREVTVPLEWFPRLRAGTARERQKWELVGAGYGVHWPDLDEDISVSNMLLGQRSAESERSLKAWQEGRKPGRRSRG